MYLSWGTIEWSNKPLLKSRNAFAYLRALAEGLTPGAAAERFLGVENAVEARTAHREIVEEVRAIARRRGEAAWRLIGVELGPGTAARFNGGSGSLRAPLPIAEWAEAEGIHGWSENDLLEEFGERYAAYEAGLRGPEGAQDGAEAQRKIARNTRLRERRLTLLRELERVAERPAQPDDQVAGWFDEVTTERLHAAGASTLAEVQAWTREGRRWWADIPAMGHTKAKAIEARVERLIGKAEAVDWSRVQASGAKANELRGNHVVTTGAPVVNAARTPVELGRPATAAASVDAINDRDAIAAWVDARSGSMPTRVVYTREGERFLLWCRLERGRALGEASVEDCKAYLEFLSDVPAHWISRKKVAPYAAGWAPFAGPLSVASRRHAVKVVASMFEWLTAARYLAANPWILVNQKLGDTRGSRRAGPTSKAFTPGAWQVLLDDLARSELTPARARLKWLCTTGEATGLRAAELLAAVRGDVRFTKAGALLDVVGKGAKHREVPLPRVALKATREYFALRGMDFDEAPETMPLVGSLFDPMKGIGYDALYETFTRFVKRALERSGLGATEQAVAAKASLHWLRHTHATRFAERGGDLDVLQATLGHIDSRTSGGYYQAQIERRQAQLEKAFAASTTT